MGPTVKALLSAGRGATTVAGGRWPAAEVSIAGRGKEARPAPTQLTTNEQESAGLEADLRSMGDDTSDPATHERTKADLDRIFGVSGYAIGYVHDFSHGKGIDVGLGGQFTIYTRPGRLDRYYGDDPGYGFQVFLRVRPSLMQHSAMNAEALEK